jgi:hypothetical protein
MAASIITGPGQTKISLNPKTGDLIIFNKQNVPVHIKLSGKPGNFEINVASIELTKEGLKITGRSGRSKILDLTRLTQLVNFANNPSEKELEFKTDEKIGFVTVSVRAIKVEPGMNENYIKLKESDLNRLVKKIISEKEVEEGIFDDAKDLYRGVKGIKRGYGMDYFKNMSRLESLVKKLKKLDIPNEGIMNELLQLKTKVSSLNIPQQRKTALMTLIDNSLYHFKKYSSINDQILSQIKTLNLDKWN